MIPTQTLAAFPEFGNSSTKVKPDDTKYSAGFVNADVVPYEWVNYLHNKASVGITDLNSGVSSMEKELNAVVTAGGATPSESSNNQVLNAINYLIAQAKSEAILAAHPIGSLYWSSKDTDPNKLFGGTWTRIKDKFILAAGDTYTAGATGGSASAQLTVSNLPSHSHSLNNHTHSVIASGFISGGTYSFTGTSVNVSQFTGNTGTEGSHTHTVGAHSHGLNSHTHSLNSHTHSFYWSGSHKHDLPTGRAYDATGSGGTDERYTGRGQDAYTRTYSNIIAETTITIDKNTGSASGNTGTPSTTNTADSTAFTSGAGSSHSHSMSHTHSVTASGSVSVSTNPTFTGSSVISGGASGDTGSTGSGTSFSIMPPYIIKYCWERTA